MITITITILPKDIVDYIFKLIHNDNVRKLVIEYKRLFICDKDFVLMGNTSRPPKYFTNFIWNYRAIADKPLSYTGYIFNINQLDNQSNIKLPKRYVYSSVIDAKIRP